VFLRVSEERVFIALFIVSDKAYTYNYNEVYVNEFKWVVLAML